MSLVTETELAYMAGIFDGEGHVGITVACNTRGVEYHRLMIGVTSTDIELVLWIKDRFGGYIHQIRRFDENPNWRDAHKWTLADGKAGEFLQSLAPYLIIKRRQAEVAVAFRATVMKGGFGSKKTPELLEHRQAMREQIMALNQGR